MAKLCLQDCNDLRSTCATDETYLINEREECLLHSKYDEHDMGVAEWTSTSTWCCGERSGASGKHERMKMRHGNKMFAIGERWPSRPRCKSLAESESQLLIFQWISAHS
jgi:hypothetical protein